MVLRLLREEEGIDKETLNYNMAALIQGTNLILKKNIPPPEKRAKTFQELKDEDFKLAVQSDPLLRLFRKYDYIYHVTRPNIEEKEHSIADLLFDYPQGVNNRYTLICTLPELTEDVRNWGIIDSNPVTMQAEVAHGVYRIFCFHCNEFFLFEMNEGNEPEQIACDKCHSVIIEKRGRHRLQLLQESQSNQ
jgi:DNA-binding Lrp family transcriptional regulator